MISEADKKWLEKRENRICKYCIHCPGYLNTSPCLDWWGDTCVMDTTLEDFRDAAEFEARVAAKLTSTHKIDRLTACDGTLQSCHSAWLTCIACRLKYARLAVEEEMIAK